MAETKQSREVLNCLAEQLKDVRELYNSRIIRTQEGRELTVRLVRLYETLVHGAPTTKLEPRHHA